MKLILRRARFASNFKLSELTKLFIISFRHRHDFYEFLTFLLMRESSLSNLLIDSENKKELLINGLRNV